MHQINVSITNICEEKVVNILIYTFQASRLKPRIVAVRINPDNKGKKSWKPVKSKEPDCASYEYGQSKDFVSKKSYTHQFAMPKDSGHTHKNETFTA